MPDVLGIKDECLAYAQHLHASTEECTAFVLILYRRRLDGTEETSLATSITPESIPEGSGAALRACAKLLDEHNRGVAPSVLVDVPKAGQA